MTSTADPRSLARLLAERLAHPGQPAGLHQELQEIRAALADLLLLPDLRRPLAAACRVTDDALLAAGYALHHNDAPAAAAAMRLAGLHLSMLSFTRFAPHKGRSIH